VRKENAEKPPNQIRKRGMERYNKKRRKRERKKERKREKERERG